MQKERLVVCQKNDSSIVSFIVMSDASDLMVGSLVASVDTSFFLDSCSLPLVVVRIEVTLVLVSKQCPQHNNTHWIC